MSRPMAGPIRFSIALAGLLVSSASFAAQVSTRLEFIGQSNLRPGLQVKGRAVGGLSGITYDPTAAAFYVVSDEPSLRFPASFFVLEVDLEGGRLKDGGVRVTDVVTLLDKPGQPFEARGVDLEGAALTADGTLIVSSEGQIARRIPPFLREFELDGQPVRAFKLPDRYLPQPGGSRGVRNNLGLEALTVTPDNRYAIVATENALIQDGPESELGSRSPSRIARFDLRSGSLVDEFVYWAEPVASPAAVAGGLEVAGLVELIALDESHLLSLERSFSIGSGNTIRLFFVSLRGATDISHHDSLSEIDLESIRPAAKQLLVDLSDLDVNLDNLEGMTFGPALGDGRRSLILVSDDNFNYPLQVSQIVAFAVSTEPTTISHVQGAGHVSPLEGQWLGPLSGIVTALQGGKEAGFWMQDTEGDVDAATSEAIQVLADHAEEVAVGDRVQVWGRVAEEDNRYGLTVTALQASSFEILGNGVDLPAAVWIGRGGRRLPDSVVDDDGLQRFEPEYDGIDFWESLEGMRVEIRGASVVGPTTRRGDLVVVADSGLATSGRTAVGGVLLRPGDANPERLIIDSYRLGGAPRAAVGDRFEGSLTGILDYRFGAYRLVATQALPELDKRPGAIAHSALTGGKGSLTIATYNVENLDPSDGGDRFRRLATGIVDQLDSPDILALQEVQDNSGAEDDGVVEADETFEGLIMAIHEAGGPAYEYCQIDPENGADGGQPGGNIRVGFLFNPERVELSSSPGLVEPAHLAFQGDETRGFEPARKSLAVEFEFRGKKLFVVNNHLKSKRGDDPLFGPRQPPFRATEDQRSQQAAVIAGFVGDLLQVDPTSRVIVLGDLNDHEFRSPLRILEAAGLVNLMSSLPEAERYSFNYRGSSQLLDHVLVSRSLYEEARPEVEILHINADAAFDDRASDHDPVVVRLHLD